MSDKRKQSKWLAGATQAFSELLCIEPNAVLVAQPIPGVDLALQVLGKLFVVELKASSSIIPLKTAIEQLRKPSLPIEVQAVPVVCVPFI
jgi:hypothetical protein